MIFAAAAMTISAACTGTPTLPSTTISTMSISGAPPGVGTSAQYIASIVSATSTSSQDVTSLATWTSSDTTIATVSRGLVTGVKAGTATITATYNGSTVSQQVAVHT